MKREDLKALGLEKEQIDKIMNMNGDDINATKSDMQATIDAKDNEIKTINDQLQGVQKDLKKYDKLDIEEIKENAKEWETKFNETQKELENVKNTTALEKELSGANVQDIEMISKVLNHELLKFEDGKIVGLDEQIKELKENKPFLFKTEVENDDKKEDKFNPLEIEPSSGGEGKSSFETQVDEIFGIKQ